MTTRKAANLKKFMCQCLEAPEDAAPVIDKGFRSFVHWQMRERWNLAKAAYDFAVANLSATPVAAASIDTKRQTVREAMALLFETPAPTLNELAWKKRRLNKTPDSKRAAAAISRDELFHAVWSSDKI